MTITISTGGAIVLFGGFLSCWALLKLIRFHSVELFHGRVIFMKDSFRFLPSTWQRGGRSFNWLGFTLALSRRPS